MTSPPRNEKGAPQQESAPRKTQSISKLSLDASNLQEELLSQNAIELSRRGVRFNQNGRGDLLVRCPECKGKLIIAASQPWHHCLGIMDCPARSMTFDHLLATLEGRA